MGNRAKIDETDTKILRALLRESRTSFTEIAKDCKITVAAVRKRYKRLRKTGVIKGEIMQVNPHSMGYGCVTDIGILTTIEAEEEVIKFLKTKSYIVAIIPEGFGRYNVGATIVLPNIEKLARIIENIESNPHIKHVDTLIWAEAKNMDHGENLLLDPAKGKLEPLPAQRPPPINHAEIQLDEIDRQIARILTENSRVSFSKIAKQLDISVAKVIQKYKRLRGTVLTLSTIRIDLEKLGYNALVHLFIKAANRSMMPEIHDQILQIPNLVVAIRLIGPYDLRAIIPVADLENVFELTENIRKIRGIEQADIFLFRITFAWPLNVFAPLL